MLPTNKTCPCGSAMQLSPRSDVSNGVRFRCPDCHKCTSIRDGSFFSKSRLALKKWVVLMYWWARNYPVTDAAREAEVTEATACAVYQWLIGLSQLLYFFLPIILFRISHKMLLLFPTIAPLFSIIIVNYSHQELRKVRTKHVQLQING